MMLQNFRFARYRFTYTVLEPLRLPPYKGNTFRSRFEYILRDITCIGDTEACKTTCQSPNQCIYARCFETALPDDNPILGDQQFAPHPFILEPPRTGKLEYAPDDTLTCDLILIGEAIDLLPWTVFTFDQIGRARIGVRGERGRCRLESVESLPAGEDNAPEPIYTAENQMLTGNGLILRPDDVIRTAPPVANRVELEFLTPTSINSVGHWTGDLRFGHFIRNLLHRIRLLSYFHCGEDLDLNVDTANLFKAADTVAHESQLRWVQADRWSRRAASTPMGGFIGKIRYSGNLTLFLPFIFLGAHLHIGHHTALGYGQYRVRGVAV